MGKDWLHLLHFLISYLLAMVCFILLCLFIAYFKVKNAPNRYHSDFIGEIKALDIAKTVVPLMQFRVIQSESTSVQLERCSKCSKVYYYIELIIVDTSKLTK